MNRDRYITSIFLFQEERTRKNLFRIPFGAFYDGKDSVVVTPIGYKWKPKAFLGRPDFKMELDQ